MKSIEVKVLNPSVVKESRDMLVAMARLTQRAEKISNMEDLENLLSKAYSEGTVQTMVDLPHPTIQKFGVINVAIVGASRRFLAQITRHQNEVKFMSGSLQYSDYSDDAQFVIPYEIIEADQEANMMHALNPDIVAFDNPFSETYLSHCKSAMNGYKNLCSAVGNDAAGYAAPQGLRNVLIISATPYQFKHMISQRSCNRNTKETQFVMLKVWEALFEVDPILFSDCGPYCTKHNDCPEGRVCQMCPEGKMTCGRPPSNEEPKALLKELFPLIRR